MNKAAVTYAVGKMMQILGAILLVPLGFAFYDFRGLSFSLIVSQPDMIGLIAGVVLAALGGTFLTMRFRQGKGAQGVREGFAIVTIAWVSMTFCTSLPLFFHLVTQNGIGFASVFTAFTDAFFETMSGYTTTGATIITNIEALPRSILFIRALSHWLGGMGIITLAIAILPSMGVTAYSMFKGEMPGPSKDRFRPRLAQTVSVLWGVYVLFTAIETGLLWIGGMNLFESICHSFATMATGGFSTENGSVAAYNSDFIEWVIIVFMYLAGVNFILHFKALRGDFKPMLGSVEFKFYNGIIVGTILIASLMLHWGGLAPIDEASRHYRHSTWTEETFAEHYEQQAEQVGTLYGAIRVSTFQTVAIVTTTGFATADFDLWPEFLRFLLVFLMFFGGCAGSTGGGMKMIRVLLVVRVAWTVLRKIAQPRLVLPVKIGRQVIDDNQVVNVVAFFILFTSLFIVTGLLMTLFVPDLTTALTCSIATIGNIGPGLAGVGAVENYSWIPLPGKWILILSMLLGRLEIFTVLILFRPAVWRK